MRNRNIFAIFASVIVALVIVGCAPATDSQRAANMDTWKTSGNPALTYTVNAVNNKVSDAIRNCNREPGSGVLLSFDDGGTPEQVLSILDALAENNTQAAFFPTGEWAVQHLGIIEKMKDEGHIVGNHTQNHVRIGKLSATNPSKFYAETYPLEGVANTDPLWIRPPFEDGAHDKLMGERLAEKGMQICTWTADTHDWAGDSVEQMMQRLIVGDEYSPTPLSRDGVVLLHINSEHAAEMVGEITSYLKSKDIKVAPLNG